MNEKVQYAIQAPPDYSETFSNFVGEICQQLSSVFETTLLHDSDMNYSSAQHISLWLDESYMPVNAKSDKVLYKLIVFISSKGPFFTFLCKYCKDVSKKELKKEKLPHSGQYWLSFNQNEIPPQFFPYMKHIEVELTSFNYTLLSGAILREIVEGHQTDMDGRPATLFDVLFSELH